MVSINQTDLVGSLVPNARISKITLETKGDILIERNPHIDDEREPDRQIDPRTGKIVRSYKGSDLLDKTINPQPLTVTVDVVLKEKLNDSLIGEWFGNQEFSKFIKVLVVQSTDGQLTREISKNKNRFLDALVASGRWRSLKQVEQENQFSREIRSKFTLLKSKLIDVAGGIEGDKINAANHYTEQDEDGNQITTFTFRKSFEIKTSNPNHLSYFVFSFLDFEELEKEFQIDLNIPSLEQPVGTIVSDIVIDEGRVIGDSFMYADPEGKIWAGAIDVEGGDIFGINEEGSRIKLQKTQIGNSKVQDFRNFKDIERLVLDFSIIENEILNLKLENPRRENLNISLPKTYFSDLYISRDDDDNSRFMFFMDFRKLLENNAKFDRLFLKNNAFRLAMQNSAILSMKIFRRRIAGSPEAGSKANPNILFDNNQFDETVISSGEKFFGGFTAANNAIGGIKEIQRLFTPPENQNAFPEGIRQFTGIDKTMPLITDGYYQYGVELEILDSSQTLLESSLKTLISNRFAMEDYYIDATRLGTSKNVNPFSNPHIDHLKETRKEKGESKPGNFDSNLNRFTQSFIEEQRKKYSSLKTRPPWTSSIKAYLKVLNVFLDDNQEFDLADTERKLLYFTSPATGNPTGILKVIQLMKKLESDIAKTIGINDVTGVSALIGRSSNSSQKKDRAKNSPSIRTFKIRHVFKETFNSSVNSTIGYDILDTEAAQDESKGLKTITGREFAFRVERETDKLFIRQEDRAPDINITTNGQTLTQNDSIQASAYGYLTPSRVCIEGEELNLLGRSPVPRISSDIYTLFGSSVRKYNTSPQKINTSRRKPSNPRSSLGFESQKVFRNSVDFLTNYSAMPVVRNVTRVNRAVTNVVTSPSPFKRQPVNLDPITEDQTVCKSEPFDVPKADPTPLMLYITLQTQPALLPTQTVNFKSPVFRFNTEQTIFTNTIRNFDLNSPNNFVSRMITNPRLIITKSFSLGAAPVRNVGDAVAKLPNHYKALLLSREKPGIIRRNWINTINVSDDRTINDPIKSRNVEFCLSHMIYSVLLFRGFELDTEGAALLKKPKWEPLSLESYNEATGEALLCRLQPYENKMLMRRDRNLELPVFDEYFILQPQTDAVLSPPKILSFNAKPGNVTNVLSPIKISWSTDNAEFVTINTNNTVTEAPDNFKERLPAKGQAEVRIGQTTEFTLTAFNIAPPEGSEVDPNVATVSEKITVPVSIPEKDPTQKRTRVTPKVKKAEVERLPLKNELRNFVEFGTQKANKKDIKITFNVTGALRVRIKVFDNLTGQELVEVVPSKHQGEVLIPGDKLSNNLNKILILGFGTSSTGSREILHRGIENDSTSFFETEAASFQTNDSLEMEDKKQTSVQSEYMSNNIIKQVKFGFFT